MKLSELQGTTKFELLQVGESGHGKTHRALTATQFGPVFVIDTDCKVDAYAKKLSKEQADLIEVRQCKTAQQVVDALKFLQANPDKYATVILDTWSTWHDLLITDYLARNDGKRASAKAFDGSELVTLAQPDWGNIKKSNERFLFQLRSLPQNLIINTHVGMKQMDDGSTVLTVGTAGSFSQEMPRFFKETHYIYISPNNEHKVRGRKSGKLTANSSLPESVFDTSGNFKVNDLSIFKGIAKEVK